MISKAWRIVVTCRSEGEARRLAAALRERGHGVSEPLPVIFRVEAARPNCLHRLVATILVKVARLT